MENLFKLVHQNLIITRICFEQKLLVGLVELHLLPTQPDVTLLRINCKQCRIFEVQVNELYTAEYAYCDPTIQVTPYDSNIRSLASFQNNQGKAFNVTDADSRNGELTVYLPKQILDQVNDNKLMRVTVEFALHNPAGGLQFVLPKLDDGTLLKNAMHLFTYRNENSSRLWFPCIDSYSEACTWKIEVTTEAMMTVVSCGELVDTSLSPDGTKKTFYYELNVPTSASNIAMAIGPFEQHVDANMNEVKHYCLPHLMPLLKVTTSLLYEDLGLLQAFEYYEEVLSVRYPYQSYKQVFVNEAYSDAQSFSSMTIFNTNLLHSAQVIEQNPISRIVQAYGIAQQFFGCFLAKRSWFDTWLTVGIAKFLAHQFQKNVFGNNEYKYVIKQELDDICKYEQEVAPISLDPSAAVHLPHFDVKRGETVPEQYTEIFSKKSHLVLRMLENRLGKELLLQVFNKILALAAISAGNEYTTGMWDNLIISTQSFLKSISTVTGKDMHVFVEQWVQQPGCTRFSGNFIFNRKRNVVELELKQDMTSKGALRYVGPLTVTIQELDGSFNHTFKIEENKYKFEITCHSKSRRNKKKKIPLMTGEEVDMDLSAMDADSPVLWLRIDPDMQTLRQVSWDQPDFMWQYQLRYERDVVAQLEAIESLENYPTVASRQVLMDVIDDDHCFYRVRMKAAHCLAKVANLMTSTTWAGPPAMMNIFRKMYGSQSCPNIVRQHRFKNFQHYHLQKAIPIAMATLRTSHGICPTDVLRFILDMFKYSDNSRNKYSDCYYLADLVEALNLTITPAVAVVSTQGQKQSSLSLEAKLILEEVTRLLNLEKLLPSYRYVISISCLNCVRTLQRNGHLPSTAHLFKNYAQYGMFIDVRHVAINIIAGFLKEESSLTQQPQLEYLLNLAETDPVPLVRFHVLRALTENCDKICNTGSELNSQDLANRLWKLINNLVAFDSKLCAEAVQLYHKLYGRKKPAAFSIPELETHSECSSVPYPATGSTAGPSHENVTMEVGMDDASAMDGRDDSSKSKLKKKKKKNKHKHKHKSDKKEKELEKSPSRREIKPPEFANIVTDTVLTLSEPSSPEMDI